MTLGACCEQVAMQVPADFLLLGAAPAAMLHCFCRALKLRSGWLSV